MASPGVYMSGLAHAGLLGWLLAGWAPSVEPPEIDVTPVSLISSAEFARMTETSAPDPSTGDPTAPAVPVIEDQPPEPIAPSPPSPREVPQEVIPPEPDVMPEVPAPIAPPSDVTDEPPMIAPPDDVAQDAIDEPIIDARPQARPAPRVSSVPTPEPDPLPTTDAPAVPQTRPEPVEETEPQEPEEQAAAEPETSTQSVAEAERPSGAVATALRPSARPVRAEQSTEAATETDALSAALQEAIGQAPYVPVGPPLTAGEEADFTRAIRPYWNVSAGSQAATITVTVRFTVNEDRKVVENRVLLSSASQGSPSARTAAFEAARRAILNLSRQSGGLPLPEGKYDTWREMELTFDPEQMRLR